MDNRTNILDVSLRLFHQKGYDAVSVQEIVDAAGITKPTLYYYFGSKYGLLEAVIEKGYTELVQQLKQAMQPAIQDVRKQLQLVAKAFLTFAIQNHEYYYFMLSLMYSARQNETYKAIEEHLVELYQIFIDLFARVGEQLGNMDGEPEQVAVGFIGFLNLFIFSFTQKHYRAEGSEVVPEDVTDAQVSAIVQQFMYGIVS